MLVEPEMDAPVSGGAPNRSGWHRRPARVLLVDDEPLLVQVLTRLLSEVHAVDASTSAKDALGRLLRSEPYDVIFCDVSMPGMSGVDFYDEVSRRSPAQARRIVFITGGVLDAAVRQRLADIDVPVLEKPVELRLLLRLADEYLELGATKQASAGE